MDLLWQRSLLSGGRHHCTSKRSVKNVETLIFKNSTIFFFGAPENEEFESLKIAAKEKRHILGLDDALLALILQASLGLLQLSGGVGWGKERHGGVLTDGLTGL